MRRLFFFVNLLVIPLLSGWVVYRRLATPPTDVVTVPHRPDYFKLALQWPPSICSSGDPKCPNNFTIHGLWPDNFNGSRPEFCDNSSRYITIKGPVLQRMRSNWPDLVQHKDQTFWEKEWSKHGTCSLFLYGNQDKYFLEALDWKDQYDFLRHFLRHQITPRPYPPYPASLIRNAVISLTTKSPDLLCVRYGHAQQRLTLHEVRFCFDPNEVMIDCPDYSSTTFRSCSGDIYFPLFPQ